MDHGQLHHRGLRGRGVLLAAITVLALAAAACAPATRGDEADQVAVGGGERQPDTAGGDASGTGTGTSTNSADGDGGGGTQLDRSQSEAASDIERRVAETLSRLDTEVRGGDTVITLPDRVLFDFDQDTLRPDAAETLDGIAEAIGFFADAPVQVAGHTDAKGTPAYNQGLSERRAQAVVDYVVTGGVDAGRITAAGFGETKPVAENTNADGSDNPEGRAQNRRVEIVIEGVDPADLGG